MPQQQTIDQLKKRYDALFRKKIEADANLRNADAQLEELKKQAMAAHGTDDLEQLQAKLQAMRQENERRRAEYQAHLEQVEGKLTEVERQFAQAENE